MQLVNKTRLISRNIWLAIGCQVGGGQDAFYEIDWYEVESVSPLYSWEPSNFCFWGKRDFGSSVYNIFEIWLLWYFSEDEEEDEKDQKTCFIFEMTA